MSKDTIHVFNNLSIKGLVANGYIGSAGQALLSNGVGTYWGSGAGFAGSRGDLGFTGSKGDIGFTGSQGDIGYTGSQGDIGYTGSQGDIGYTGSASTVIGYTGSQGDIGYTGSASTVIGYTGSQGDIGFTGSQGDIGYIGYTGSASTEVGYTGSQGIIGYTGSASTEVGYTGSQGDIGYTGSASTEVGYTGSQGDIGYTGSQGPIGYTGSQGVIGYTGSQGPIGYTGSQGVIGYTGSAGPAALPQNPTGTTYGDGVSETPTYMLSQTVGDNDGWRLYGESPVTNQVRMVFELNDDIEEALTDQWVFRNKKTYSGYNARSEFNISGSGDSYSRTSSRAPIFYDSPDTTYYLDPAGGSNLYTTKFNTATNGAAGRTVVIKDSSQSEILFGNYPGGWTSALQIQNNDNSDFVWIGPLDVNNNARFRAGGSGLDFYTDGANDAGTHSLFVGSGYAQGIDSIRAPIFYDSANTAFYVDAAGTSNINILSGNGKTALETADGYLRINQGSAFVNGIWTGSSNLLNSSGIFGWGSNGGTTTSRVYINGGTYSGTNVIAIDGTNGTILTRSQIQSNEGVNSTTNDAGLAVFRTSFAGTGQYRHSIVTRHNSAANTNNAWDFYLWRPEVAAGTEATHRAFVIDGDVGTTSTIASRAPIFYDSDNAAYFVKPANTSKINFLYMPGGIAAETASVNYYENALEIRETAFGGSLTTSVSNAPRIGFHWSNRVGMQIGMDSNGDFNIWDGTAGGYVSLRSGIHSAISSNDVQLYLNGNGTSWAGINWADVAGNDNIWYNGSGSTFAIGGGGSNVANKKLHVHGGMTIGSGIAASSSGVNNLLVESAITSNQMYSQIFYDSQNGAYYIDPDSTSVLNGLTVGGSAVMRGIGAPAGDNTNWNTLGNAVNTINEIYQSHFNIGGTGNTNFPSAASYKYGTLINFSANLNARAQMYISHNGNDLIFRGGWTDSSWQTWNKVLTDQNYTSYSPSLTGSGASGSWGISITGNAATATSATSADSSTNALRIVFNDGPRDLSDRLPNTFTRTVNWDFVGAGTGNGVGNYAGVMTFAPWTGTTASTGDSSYQLAFSNQSGVNASGPPRLSIRSGIDTTWGAWYILLTSANYTSYSPSLTGSGASGSWGINVTGTSGSISGFNNPTTAPTASTIVYRDAAGDISAREIVLSSGLSAQTPTVLVSMYPTTDQLVRTTPGAVAAAIQGAASGSWGISITGNAATATSATSASSATYLNSSNYIERAGTSGNLNTDFQNTPAGTMRYHGDFNSGTNAPSAQWWIYESKRHSNASNYWGVQVAWGWEDAANRLRTRNVTGGTFGAWVNYWNDANDGSGSGLDADLLDGLHASNSTGANTIVTRQENGYTFLNYINSNTGDNENPTIGQIVTINSSNDGYYRKSSLAHVGSSLGAIVNTWTAVQQFQSNRDTTSTGAMLQAYSSSGGATMAFHRAGVYAVNMGLDSDNVFRIGGWSASNNLMQLDMSGNVTFLANVTAYSDIRLKDNIEPISDAVSKVLQLNGVTYTRKDLTDKTRRYGGLIAQDVQKVLPDAVTDDGTNLRLDYNATIALLIEAIKEQQAHINRLEQMVNNLIGDK